MTVKQNTSTYTADTAPIEGWWKLGADAIAGRLTKHGLTAESKTSAGKDLGELFIPHMKRFNFFDHHFAGHDDKIETLLDSCTNPASDASVWLRAILEKTDDTLSRSDQFKALNEALIQKLKEHTDPNDRLKWATLSMRGAKALCKEEKLYQEAHLAAKLIGTVFSAFPETMKTTDGASLMMTRKEEYAIKQYSELANWNAIKFYYIDVVRALDPWQPMPSEMFPFQLFMIDDFNSYSMEDQKTARRNDGLVPGQMVGHAQFQNAFNEKTWPDDPRVDLILAWHKKNNPLLENRVRQAIEAQRLDEATPSAHPNRARARL